MIKSNLLSKTPKKPPRKNSSKQTDHVEVFCRVRPLAENEASDTVCVNKLNDTTVALIPPENSSALRNGPALKETRHTFQYVFDDTIEQSALFEHVALPQTEDVLKGKNALLFTYGVTSSGKTHTMTGSHDNPGILPRCLDCIFNSISDVQARKYIFKSDKMNGFDVQTEVDAMLEKQTRDITPKLTGAAKTTRDKTSEALSGASNGGARIDDIELDNSYAVFVSYIEIYNNYIYDLLEELAVDPITGIRTPASKQIREDSNHNMYVSGVTEVEIKSPDEAYDYLSKGKKRRKVAQTALNSESSRSHSIFFIRVVQAPLDPCGAEVIQDKKKICVSQLCLVDLAGSERTGRTASSGDRLKEAGNINQSLMALRSCIEALRENQRTGTNKMVPYRDSRLTHLFKNYFDGDGKIRMIVCVNPKASEYEENVQVMKFAELTQEVKIVRSLEVRFDLGLTPGRRLINQQFKDAQAKAREGGASAQDALFSAPKLVYSLGPPFPTLEMFDNNNEAYYSTLCKFLGNRDICRSTLLLDLSSKEESFRIRLLDTDRELQDLRQANAQLRSSQNSKDNELSELQKRNASLEQYNETLREQLSNYELERQELQREVGEKSWKCLQEKIEKDRLQQDYNAKLAINAQQYNINIEQAKRRLEEDTAARLRAKQQKLDMLRHIINADSDSGSNSPTPTSAESIPRRPTFQTPTTSNQILGSVKGRIFPARSETDLTNTTSSAGGGGAAGGGGTNDRKGAGMVGSSAVSAVPGRYVNPRTGPAGGVPGTVNITRTLQRVVRTKSPPPAKTQPLLPKRNHRRSKSNESIWLEHKPDGPNNDTRTLLQPCMKTIKSVTKLSERDIRCKDANKYVLNHHDITSDGEMANQFVKGDILSTAAGGTSVVFTDIEIIKHKAAGDRKRMSSEQRIDDNEDDHYDDEIWTDVETRCSTAIEGHAKRYKHADV